MICSCREMAVAPRPTRRSQIFRLTLTLSQPCIGREAQPQRSAKDTVLVALGGAYRRGQFSFGAQVAAREGLGSESRAYSVALKFRIGF